MSKWFRKSNKNKKKESEDKGKENGQNSSLSSATTSTGSISKHKETFDSSSISSANYKEKHEDIKIQNNSSVIKTITTRTATVQQETASEYKLYKESSFETSFLNPSPSLLSDSKLFQTYREAKNYSPLPRSAFNSQPFSRTRDRSLSITPSLPFSGPPPSSFRKFSQPASFKTNKENPPVQLNQLVVEVKPSEQWYHDLTGKVPCYLTKMQKIVLIINIKNFSSEKNVRAGSEIDEENLKSLFSQMGFKVESFKKSTWKKKEVESEINKFRSKNLKKYDTCIVVVMSHGSGEADSHSTVIACSDGETIKANWIVSQFDGLNCKDLQGKPKIFIFQCCRGNTKYTIKTDGVSHNSKNPFSDILIAYGTVPGFVSYRYEEIGSWYIHTLCKVFMEHACDTHVEDLLKMVNVALKDFSDRHEDIYKPTSTYENWDFKKCYLHPKLFKK